jgi:hypothetical protein
MLVRSPPRQPLAGETVQTDHTELRAFLAENERALAGYAKRLALGDDDLAREYYQQMCLNLIVAGWKPGAANIPLAYAKRVLLNGVLIS